MFDLYGPLSKWKESLAVVGEDAAYLTWIAHQFRLTRLRHPELLKNVLHGAELGDSELEEVQADEGREQ